MSASLSPIITAAGWQAITRASDADIKIAIKEIALGSQGGAVTGDETALNHEQARVAIAETNTLTAQQVQLTALVTGLQEYWIYEIGIYLEDGTLFALWSDELTPLAYKAKNVDMVLTFDLMLSALPSEQITFVTSNTITTLGYAKEFAQLSTTCIDILRRQIELGNDLIFNRGNNS